MMKKRTREAIEALLLALPCTLQSNEDLSAEEIAAGWRIFNKLLRTYIDGKRKKSKQGSKR